jgi:hypothetical protein
MIPTDFKSTEIAELNTADILFKLIPNGLFKNKIECKYDEPNPKYE